MVAVEMVEGKSGRKERLDLGFPLEIDEFRVRRVFSQETARVAERAVCFRERGARVGERFAPRQDEMDPDAERWMLFRESDRAIEYSCSYFRGDKTSFVIERDYN